MTRPRQAQSDEGMAPPASAFYGQLILFLALCVVSLTTVLLFAPATSVDGLIHIVEGFYQALGTIIGSISQTLVAIIRSMSQTLDTIIGSISQTLGTIIGSMTQALVTITDSFFQTMYRIIVDIFEKAVISGFFSAFQVIIAASVNGASIIYRDFSVEKLVIFVGVAVAMRQFPSIMDMVVKMIGKPPRA